MVTRRRRRAASRVAGDKQLLEQIRQIKSNHPFWGYRRVWAYLRFVCRMPINQKRVYRLLKENCLLVTAETKLKARRTGTGKKPRPTRANEWWGVDMTKVMTGTGWCYIVLVIDWYTKKVVGHFAGEQSRARHWLVALNKAVNRQFPAGVCQTEIELNLMSDNGSQPTSRSFMQACSLLGIKQAFTAYSNPKGNADTERMMRTLKEELLWLSEWQSVEAVKTRLDNFIEEFNENYLHSALGYKSPNKFEAEYLENKQQTLKLTA